MDVYGSDIAPDEEAAGTSGTETTPGVGSWFQRGSSNESALNDRGIAQFRSTPCSTASARPMLSPSKEEANTIGHINNSNNTNNRNTNCSYNQSTNTVGDIIFGRSGNNVNCNDNGNRVDGGWYQVGPGSRQQLDLRAPHRDANGNLVIQRARRNRNGSFTILNSRSANQNDKQWQKGAGQAAEGRQKATEAR